MSRESQHHDGGVLHIARERFHEWRDVHDQLDELFYSHAKQIGGVVLQSIFEPIPEEIAFAEKKIDAINHNINYLRANPLSTEDVERSLGFLSILHGEFAEQNTKAFIEFTQEIEFFDRLKDGQTFLLVGSHLEFQDVGFNLGYLTKAAQAEGIDRFESHVTLVIGRMLGYLQVMGYNVIDDILRPASNIQKSFPVSGGEAINEGDITDDDLTKRLKRFRQHQNARAREQIMQLVHSTQGHVIIEAGSGSRDAIDKHGNTVMEPFAKGTREDLYKAVKAGAIIIPVFGDYGDDKQPSVVKFGRPIDHLDSPEHAHEVGREIERIGNIARGGASVTYPDIGRFKSQMKYPA